CPTGISQNMVVCTRPTYYGGLEASDCPCIGDAGKHEDKEPCPGWRNVDAWECGRPIGPNALRRAPITAMLNAGYAKEDIGDRADMTPEIMDKHYNEQSEEEKMEVRKNRMGAV